MRGQIFAAMLAAPLLLAGCGYMKKAVSESNNPSSEIEGYKEKTPDMEMSPSDSAIGDDFLCEEELDQIGKIATEKWKTIGHIFSAPLYNTDLSQLSQDELRKIYSVYIFANHLDTSLVFEKTVEGSGAVRFWMGLDGLEQFVQDYFGLDFGSQENNLPEDCVAGNEIQFYFNSRFNVLPNERTQFNLINCIQNTDKTFTASIEIEETGDPNIGSRFREFDLSLVFERKDGIIIFLSAALS